MFTVNYKVTGVGAVTRHLTKFDKWITTEIPNLTKTQAIEGSRILIDKMPKQFEGMIQAVSVIPKGTQWQIVSRTPKAQSKGNARPYHIWYNDGKRGWYQGTKKSGQYHYYEKTVKALQELYPEKVRKSLKRMTV